MLKLNIRMSAATVMYLFKEILSFSVVYIFLIHANALGPGICRAFIHRYLISIIFSDLTVSPA